MACPQPKSKGDHRKEYVFSALALLLLAAFLRLYHLDRNSLWLDEITTEWYSQKTTEEMLDVLTEYDVHPPLMYLTAIEQRRLLGGSDFAARLPWAFAGILDVALMFAFGKRLMGWKGGVLAGTILALWPMHLWYSQEARNYTLLMFFSFASLYFLYRGLQGENALDWIAFALATALNLYTHYFAFTWAFAQVVLVACIAILRTAVHGRRRGVVLRQTVLPFGMSLLASFLLYLPWYPRMLAQRQRFAGGAFSPRVSTLSLILQKTAWYFSENSTYLLYLTSVLAMLGLVYLSKERRWEVLLFLFIPMVVPVAVLWAMPSGHFFHPRYLMALLGPLTLLTVAGMLGLHALLLRSLSISGVSLDALTMAALVLVVLVSMYPLDRKYYGQRKEDWRGTAEYIAAHRKPGDVIIGDGTLYDRGGDARRVVWCLGYYLHTNGGLFKAEPGLVSKLPADEDARGNVWGVIWHQLPLPNEEQAAQTAEITKFKDVTVLRLRNPTGLVWEDSARLLQVMVRMLREPAAQADERMALAEIYASLHRPDMALEQIRLAAEDVPKGDRALADRISSFASRLKSRSKLRMAEQAAKSGKMAVARDLYRQAIAEIEDPSERSRMLVEWAKAERTGGNPDVAVTVLEQALDLRPDDLEAQVNYCAALEEAGKYERAVEECRWVLRRDPRNFWAEYFLGKAYGDLGKPREAARSFETAASLGNTDEKQAMAALSGVKAFVKSGDCSRASRLAERYSEPLRRYRRMLDAAMEKCKTRW